MVEVIGCLSPEDLARWRLVYVRLRGIELNPSAYSAKETEAALMDHLSLATEIAQRYEIDETRPWTVSALTGLMYYSDDEDDWLPPFDWSARG